MKPSERKYIFIVSALGEAAAQNEDVVQLLLFASATLEHEIVERPDKEFRATILSVEPNTSGWKRLSSLFSVEALKHISVEELKEPATPCLAIPCHKAAYNFFEWLKDREFEEVHSLDRHGLAFYPSQAKRLGLYFLNTVFAVHVVGGTIFRKESEDSLLDNVDALAEDLLERGSLERADVIYIHDRKAWRWYEGKIQTSSDVRVHDFAWPETRAITSNPKVFNREDPQAIIYYGTLGVDGGLPVFCDAVERALPNLSGSVEVFFVGSPQAVSGADAVSYIRLRSAKWHVPVTIKRDLALSDELAFVFEQAGIVVCNTVRREGLRPRLVAGTDLCVLHVKKVADIQNAPSNEVCPPFPGRIAQALVNMLTDLPSHRHRLGMGLLQLWRAGRPRLPDLQEIPASPALVFSIDNQPKVSVIITHFSRPEKLRTALDSLKRQTYRNLEVIMVDDGSPESHVQVELAKIRQEIEPLGWRLVIQENRYLGAARNFGATHATGVYLLFMDDDNVAKPNEISTLVAVAQRTEADIVTVFCDVFDTDQVLEGKTPPPMRFTPYGSDSALGIFTNCYGDANALYSRGIFNKLGGFTEDYGITHEDWELFCRASLEDVKLVCVPEPLFWYRVDRNAMFRGQRTQLHKSANLRRHIRPFLEKLPYYQAKLVQLAQGITTELPLVTAGKTTRTVAPIVLREPQARIPYARVSVIMRTKDRPLLLRRAIRSVLGQAFKDWLLIIVNDGGNPDNIQLAMGEMADELAGRVFVLHHPVSLGMQTASNAGISICDSDFIIVHDDDDSWNPDFLARTLSYMDERGWDPKLGGVVTWSWVIVEELGEDGEAKEQSRFIFNDKLHNISLVDLAIENRFPPISFLIRRAALDAVEPFRERYGVLGDWEFHLRLLRRFDIGVIPEPLANYHHRTKTTAGIYGNSVHTSDTLHRSTRIDLVNSAVRDELTSDSGLSFTQLLVLGQLHKNALIEQSSEFQRLHNYLWTVENQIKLISSNIKSSPKRTVVSRGRNLARNGDFRLWPGLGKVHEDPGGKFAFMHVCPGFVLNFNGIRASYRIERRKWTEDGHRLPFGKTYLHIENDGCTQNSSWFMLECSIPSVLAMAGQAICISGMCRFKGGDDSIVIGGRYHLGDGRELKWPDHHLSLPDNFGHWKTSMDCPEILPTELRPGHEARILLKLPHDRPFELDLTDFQVERGTTPTEFEFNNGVMSLRRRLSLVWDQMGGSLWRLGKEFAGRS